MTLPYRLILTYCFSTLSIINLTAQVSPCMCLESENRLCSTQSAATATTPFAHNSRSILLEISDSTPSLQAFPGARYKAFWMFGDGNFAYFPHATPAADLLTLRQNYTYRRSGRYTTEAVLSEKKSNTRPPVRDRRIIQVGTTVAPGSGTSFVQRLAGNVQTADILPSDSMRPHRYLTAFAVSAPRHEANSGIYFFYNSIVNGGSLLPAAMHEYTGVNLPDYAGTSVSEGLTGSLTNQLGIELSRKFKNYIFVPITAANFGSMPPDVDFTEYRIFPILETIWGIDLPKCRFLAVIVGKREASGGSSDDASADERRRFEGKGPMPDDFFTLEKLAELERMAGAYFSKITLAEPVYYDSTQNPVYVRGMYEVDVPMVGSIDPNELEVISICPLNDGQYEVKMRLQVCNRGIIPVESVPVRLIDHTGGQFTDFKFLPEFSTLDSTLNRDNSTHTWTFVYNKGLEGVSTPEDLGATEAGTPYEPKCLEVYFTLRTSVEGAKQLLTGKALETCATFPGSNFPDECHFNFPVDSTRFTVRNGYNCGNDQPLTNKGGSYGLLFFLLVLILIVILMWWIFRKKD